MGEQSGVRPVPRWYPAVVITFLTIFTLAFLGLALFVDDGVMGISAWGLFLFAAPALTAWSLVGAWLAVLVVAGIWAYVAVTDLDALESPGFSLLTIVGAAGSLPDLVRLLTGRLHRWRLELGPETVTYRGYRTDQSWPWSKVHGARIQQGRPVGVAIDLRGAGADPVVPLAAFDVPGEQLVEEIDRAKAAARR
jgi:hypothetical protein